MRRALGILAVIMACAAAAGCDVFLPAMGGEGQSCFENLTCKKDLLCIDGVCRARIEPDGGDGGDGADGGDLQAGDDGGPGDADAGTDSGPDGDGFIPECTTGELRCQERTLRRCEAPGVWRDDHRCNVGCDAAGVDCLKVVDIAAGMAHTCVVFSDGRVVCWGYNEQAQLGIGQSGGDQFPPAAVLFSPNTALREARRVALTKGTSCALRRDGSVVCWGGNAQGECGVSPAGGNVLYPMQVANLTAVDLVGGTWTSLCAITADGQAKCWGCSMVGDACWESQNFNVPPRAVAGLERVRSMGLGTHHACAVVEVDGTTQARCFGNGSAGQLGNASLNLGSSSDPVPVDDSGGWIGVGCSDYASFAWSAAGAYSWGSSGGGGVLGDGINSNHQIDSPGPLLLIDEEDRPLPVRSIRGGFRHACAEVEAGNDLVRVFCWGRNSGGEVGQPVVGQDVHFAVPMAVSNLPPVRHLAVGWAHNCAILEDDETVVCWGTNDNGQLGLVHPSTPIPVDVPFP